MYILGLMSGTSCDGVDLALTEINSLNDIQILDCYFHPYPDEIRDRLLQMISSQAASFREIKELEDIISSFFLESIKSSYSRDQYELLGVHGQTIFHEARSKIQYGKTWQLLNPEILSKGLDADLIYDFRSTDIAVGGQGAPLVPFLDYYYFNDEVKSQCLVNIGGISNGSFLKKGQKEEDLLAYDFGPGNCLIDLAMKELFNRTYDHCGETALKGKANKQLIEEWLKNDKFIHQPSPKSTGREYYSYQYYQNLKAGADKMSLNKLDFLASLTNFTFRCIDYHIKNETGIDEVLITGGGAKNNYLMNCFKKEGYQLKHVSDTIIDFKEAVLIALLAFAFETKKTSNFPSVTGAKEKVILGRKSLGKFKG
jgi:anhydro-N-acetylmuramic acid kinase